MEAAGAEGAKEEKNGLICNDQVRNQGVFISRNSRATEMSFIKTQNILVFNDEIMNGVKNEPRVIGARCDLHRNLFSENSMH